MTTETRIRDNRGSKCFIILEGYVDTWEDLWKDTLEGYVDTWEDLFFTENITFLHKMKLQQKNKNKLTGNLIPRWFKWLESDWSLFKK